MPYRCVVPRMPIDWLRALIGSNPTISTTVPVQNGGNARSLSLQTAEQGPQVSVFLPQYSLSARTGPIRISVSPEAPADAPPGTSADGNVYVFAFVSPGGTVTLNPKYGGTATLYLRATSQRQPQPTMYYRADGSASWQQIPTTAGGLDIRVASFRGPGHYLLAVAPTEKAKSGGGVPVAPLVLLGVLVALVAVVLVVRLRASSA